MFVPIRISRQTYPGGMFIAFATLLPLNRTDVTRPSFRRSINKGVPFAPKPDNSQERRLVALCSGGYNMPASAAQSSYALDSKNPRSTATGRRNAHNGRSCRCLCCQVMSGRNSQTVRTGPKGSVAGHDSHLYVAPILPAGPIRAGNNFELDNLACGRYTPFLETGRWSGTVTRPRGNEAKDVHALRKASGSIPACSESLVESPRACHRDDSEWLYTDLHSLEPDLVTSGRLTVEREAKRLELPRDLSIPKSGQTAHQAATTIV